MLTPEHKETQTTCCRPDPDPDFMSNIITFPRQRNALKGQFVSTEKVIAKVIRILREAEKNGVQECHRKLLKHGQRCVCRCPRELI
jgi:hypothetical protein